jgi:aspartate racemase
MTRVVGLIGGMSWQTTALYYKEINQHVCSKLGGVHSANLLIKSIDYADIARMVTTKDFDSMIEMLCECGKQLKQAGANSLVLCANVAHKAADALERYSGLPVLHIVDSTAGKIVSAGYRKVGLLATRAVMEESFYKARLIDKYGLEVVVPDGEFRARVDGLIFDELSKDPISEDVKSCFKAAYAQLVQDHQVDCIILACTELRLVFAKADFSVPTFETTALHAEGIAEWALLDGLSKKSS